MNVGDHHQPPLYPRLPTAPSDEHRVGPPRPVYPPGRAPGYPAPGMHRPGPLTGAVHVLPSNGYDSNANQNINNKPEVPPKPHHHQYHHHHHHEQQPEVVIQPEVIVVSNQPCSEKEKEVESDTEAPPVVEEETTEVQRLRKRNYIFMALAGVSFLLCVNIVCGAVALVFALLAEMDLGHGRIKDGAAKSVVSIVLTVVGAFMVITLLAVFLVVNS